MNEPIERLVSVLVPLYNEEEHVATTVRRVLDTRLPEGVSSEIVIVDDASTDASLETLQPIVERNSHRVRIVRHDVNRGKGAAVRTAIRHARGEFCIIQDADLEYHPAEFPRLLRPLLEDRADLVYGSRFLVSGERRVLFFWHSLGNRLLTTLCNMAADLNLTDMETCYKAFRTSLVRSIPLRSERFGIEPEITLKAAQRQFRIYEIPISYHGRTYDEGKKIGLRDAVEALFVIGRHWLVRDAYVDPGAQILDSLSRAPNVNRWMADVIRPHVGASVLEIGAGIGNLTRELSRGRTRYVASDVDDDHLSRLRARFEHRPGIEVARCDLACPEHFAPYAGQMTTVVCLNVLEHVEDDASGARNIADALAPGGRAIVLVPEGMRLFGSLDRILGHHRRYSERELEARLEEAGLRLERMLRFNRISRPGWYVNGRLLRREHFGRFQLWTFDRLVWLWRRVDGWLPWRPLSIIAVAVKDARETVP